MSYNNLILNSSHEQRFNILHRMAFIFEKLSPNAFAPIRTTTFAAGYDLRSPRELRIPIGKRYKLWIDIAVRFPPGYYGRIAPCSDLACFDGIDIVNGVLDSDYSGNIAVILINNGYQEFIVEPGMKVAQLLVEHCLMVDAIEVEGIGMAKRGMLGLVEAKKRMAKRSAPNEDDDDEGVFSGSSSSKRLRVDSAKFELPEPPESPTEDDDTQPSSKLIISNSITELGDLANAKV